MDILYGKKVKNIIIHRHLVSFTVVCIEIVFDDGTVFNIYSDAKGCIRTSIQEKELLGK